MRKKTLYSLALSLLLVSAAAFPVFAASEHGGGHMSDHGTAQESAHEATHEAPMHHGAHENMVLIGEQTIDGVKAVAHLNDVHEALAKAGMKETHHLQIMFTDTAANKNVETGSAAVKITLPSGETLAAHELHGMEGHFGSDLALSEPGKYTFAVGTKLADGKKRQFEFSTMIH
jgi:hypothetical protein